MLAIFAHWFCILRLCWSCLSALGTFGLRRWSFLDIRSYHLQIKIIWLPLFLFECPLFLSLVRLPWLELPVLHWIGVVRDGILVLCWFSRGHTSSFCRFNSMLAVGLSCIALIILKYVPAISYLLGIFNMNVHWVLSKVNSASIEKSCSFCL